MEYTIKIKLSSGKEIELTKEELEELIRNHFVQTTIYPMINPIYPSQIPYYPDRWYYPKSIEVTC